MKKSVFLLALLLLTLACCSLSKPHLNVPVAPSFDTFRLGGIDRNVTYCVMDGTELRLDVYYPMIAEGRWPALVYVHGGSWTGGDKRGSGGFGDRPALVKAGFLVVSVNYRLAPESQFPAMIEDVKCAVRYLRAHADEYNLDPGRIGAWGNSAGGHLVALLGLSDESAGWDVGEYLDYASRVQAVVDFYGPTDLETLLTNNSGHIFRDEDLAAASPIHHISEGDPPFLILQGDQDRLVPLVQSQILYERLQEKNIPAELVIVKGGGHGFSTADSPNMQPTREEITQLVVAFFEKYLK